MARPQILYGEISLNIETLVSMDATIFFFYRIERLTPFKCSLPKVKILGEGGPMLLIVPPILIISVVSLHNLGDLDCVFALTVGKYFIFRVMLYKWFAISTDKFLA